MSVEQHFSMEKCKHNIFHILIRTGEHEQVSCLGQSHVMNAKCQQQIKEGLYSSLVTCSYLFTGMLISWLWRASTQRMNIVVVLHYTNVLISPPPYLCDLNTQEIIRLLFPNKLLQASVISGRTNYCCFVWYFWAHNLFALQYFNYS